MSAHRRAARKVETGLFQGNDSLRGQLLSLIWVLVGKKHSRISFALSKGRQAVIIELPTKAV